MYCEYMALSAPCSPVTHRGEHYNAKKVVLWYSIVTIAIGVCICVVF